MRQIFFIITVIFLLNHNIIADAKDATQDLEEVKTNTSSNRQIQSIEEITADLKAKKEAAEPFNDKDIKIDVESLGLDPVDDKKKTVEKPASPQIPELPQVPQEKVPQQAKLPVVPPKPVVTQAAPIKVEEKKPSKKPDIVSAVIEKEIPKIPTPIAANSAAVDIKGNIDADGGNKILSKIQNFISGKSNAIISQIKNTETKEESSTAKPISTKSEKALKREKLRQRIAEERKAAAIKKAKERKEAKEKRLNKLREEYLIKLNNNELNEEVADSDFKTEPAIIVPKEKSFRWSDRSISYDPAPLPILDNYRGNDNKHIPTIPTVQDRIDSLFQTINTNNTPYFNSAYQYVLDPNIHNPNGETILTYATLLQKYGVISSILAKGADPDLPNALGHTPLDIAIEILDMKSAQILLSMNADPNYVDGLGRTYLMHASRVGFLPMVDLLVSQGVDVNATDNEGITALAIAYKHKKDVIAKFLLKAGAQPWIQKPYHPDQQYLIKELENRWGNKNETNKNDEQN